MHRAYNIDWTCPYVCKSNRYLSTLQVVQTKRLRVFLDNRSSGLFLPTVRKCQKLQIRLNGRPPKNQMSPGSTTSPNFFSSFYLSLVEAPSCLQNNGILCSKYIGFEITIHLWIHGRPLFSIHTYIGWYTLTANVLGDNNSLEFFFGLFCPSKRLYNWKLHGVPCYIQHARV